MNTSAPAATTGRLVTPPKPTKRSTAERASFVVSEQLVDDRGLPVRRGERSLDVARVRVGGSFAVPPPPRQTIVCGLNGSDVGRIDSQARRELAHRVGEAPTHHVDLVAEFEQAGHDFAGTRHDVPSIGRDDGSDLGPGRLQHVESGRVHRLERHRARHRSVGEAGDVGPLLGGSREGVDAFDRGKRRVTVEDDVAISGPTDGSLHFDRLYRRACFLLGGIDEPRVNW